MGRRNRERIARIERGEEQPIADKEKAAAVARLGNPLARKAVAIASRKGVVDELQKASTEEQIEVLSGINPSKLSTLGRAIMKKAPGEIDKGILLFRQQGKEITVDALLEEARATPGFLDMCYRAGISYAWFEELARERMIKHGIAIT